MILSTEVFKKALLVIWLSLMLIIPKEYGIVKGILLACICVMSLYYIFKGQKVNLRECVYFLSFISYFLASLLMGIILGWKFDIAQDYALIFYYVFTPICVFFFGYLYFQDKRIILKICFNVTFIIVVLDLLRIFMILGIFPTVEILDFIVRVDSQQTLANELTLRISNESSLLFLLPFDILLINTLNKKNIMKFKYYNSLIVLSAILGTLYAMLSGRRMLEIATILAWIITGYWILRQRKITIKSTIKLVAGVAIALFAITYVINLISTNTALTDVVDMIINTFINGFIGATMQNRQSYIPGLIELWSQSPVFGNGLNAYGEILANYTTYWSYEVVFLALLGQAGIIGVFIIFLGIIAVLSSYYNIVQSTHDLTIKRIYKALGIASVIFILAGLSNPQVYYSWFWGIFFAFSKWRQEK